jgi:hypothetical protein
MIKISQNNFMRGFFFKDSGKHHRSISVIKKIKIKTIFTKKIKKESKI